MDIQAMSAATTASSNASATGAVTPSTPPSASGNDSSFAVILVGQQLADVNGQANGVLLPDQQTTSLIGLLQMLQTMLSPLQTQALAAAGSEQQGNTLPELLLQAINDPSKLSDQLLQDPSLQQWLEQAAVLLPTLPLVSGNSSSLNASVSLSAATDPEVATRLTAQQTLLQFAAALKQMPNNPIVQHLMTELNQAAEPMFANLVQTNATDAANAGRSVVANGRAEQLSANHTLADTVAQQMVVSSVVVESSSDTGLQQTKANLEMLAAKSGMISAVQQQSSGNAAEQGSMNSSTQDNASTFQMPTMPLQDLLKTLQTQAPIQTQATIHAPTLVRDLSEFMAGNMKLSVSEVFKQAKLSLRPENLGQIDVQITLHANGQLVAQLTADTMAGKQLLESQLPQLRQALQNQGLQVERLEVAQEQAASSSLFQQSRQQGGGGQPFERETRSNTPEIDAVDAEFAKDLRTLADVRSEEGGSFGGSFDASA